MENRRLMLAHEQNETEKEQNSNIEDQPSNEETSTPETKDVSTTETPEEASVDSTKDTIDTPSDSTSSNTTRNEENDQEEDLRSSDDIDQEDEAQDEYFGILVKDYDEMNIDALGEELERLLKDHKVKEIRQHVRDIKAEFDLKFGEEREAKKKEFLEAGGNIIDFSYSTPSEKKFLKHYFDYKERRDNYYKKVRRNLQENLERRLAIIEELKAITGVGTDMNANFNEFKKIQEQWRKAGPVPQNDYKDTWNTYHHHVERFYDFLHLDREFRELDYKHNLEQKLKMIDRAEELAQEKDINRAFRELQNLHRMWKEDVGPVAQEYREPVWEKFSTATKKIHENRRAYYAEQDELREKNLEAKQAIIEKIEALDEEDINSHGQAQKKIKIFKELREQFFNAGRVPKKDNQPTWDAFKAASRAFNHKKNEFYKKRKEEHKENLDKKMELIKIAEEHQDSDDFETVTPLMKKIQGDWKKIGYVKRSKSDKIWKRFKKACNHYFDRLHARQDAQDEEAMKIYEQKEALLKEVEALELSGDRQEDLPKIKEKIEAWKNLGRVPRKKRNIEGKFNKALDHLFNQLDMNRKETEMLKYENRLENLSNDDEQIEREAFFLNKKVQQTADEIRKYEANLQLFSNPSPDNPLMKDTYKNIEKLKQQLKIWKAKLNKVRQL